MKAVDLAIIGGGAAGLVAAATAASRGLATLLIEQTGAGGQVINVDHLDNLPGHPTLAGYDFGPALQLQAEEAGAEFMLSQVERIEPGVGSHRLHTGDGIITARTIVVAAGSSKRLLGVPGEERLLGRGVSQCASCDGPMFRGQPVCVVGGGDSAIDEALALAAHAGRVTIIVRNAAFSAQQRLVDRLAASPEIEVLFGCEIEDIAGDVGVSGLRLRRANGERFEMATHGVFVYVGLAPNTAFLDGQLALDADGRIVVDGALQSSVRGIFAAGDIRSGSPSLLASSMGDGASAAWSAWQSLQA